MWTENKILLDDFSRISDKYDFSPLKESSVFITGSTGLLGSQLVLFLDYLNVTKNYNTKIIALVRSKEKANRIFGDAINHVTCIYGDVLNLPNISEPVDYIIHGASITSSKSFIEKCVETIDIAVNGTMSLLKLAKDKNVKSFIYLSSMEAFGITDGKGEVRETDLGYIDVLNPRSSYMESKRMCENLCVCFASEYGVPAKMIRLTQTLGAGIDYNDTRVAAYFARSVIENTDIVLKTKGDTKRPILYTSDALSAILTVLLKGENAQVYTAANPATFVTIRETAEMIVEKIAHNAIKLTYDIKEVPAEYAPNLNLNLNIDKLSSLGWKPQTGLEESYKRMIEGMWEELEK